MSAGFPYTIVSKLTDKIIRSAVQEFIDAEKNLYWLKLSHVTTSLNIKDINELISRKEKENAEIEEKIEAES